MAYLEEYDRISQGDPAKGVGYIAGLIRSDPQGLFRELRGSRPIFRTPGFTLVTKFKDVQEVLSRNGVFTVKLYAPKMDPVVAGPFMLARDDTPTNWREKSIMKAMLRPEDLPAVRAGAGRYADASLDACAQAGKIEVVGGLGRRVPADVCEHYFGFPGPDRPTLLRWSKATQSDFFKNLANDPAVHAASVEAGKEMRPYLTALLAEKRAKVGEAASPPENLLERVVDAVLPGMAAEKRAKAHEAAPHPEDIFSRLVRTELPQELGFDDSRVVANMAGLLIGAIETTSQAIAQSLRQILGRPEVLSAAIAAAKDSDDAAFDAIVWEALRFDPINPLVFRLCESEYVVASGTPRQATIPPGTVVFACTASAQFDEDDVPDPETFNANRAPHQVMHFGYGDHTCLGKYVGLMIIPEAVKRVLLRPNPRLIPGDEGKLDFQGGFFPEKFTIAFDAA